MKTLPTGSTIGIFGGGQLGRMIAMDAARLGYACHIFTASKSDPALEVCAAQTIAAFDDEDAIEAFAKSVNVITLEWENVPLRTLEIASKHAPVFPGAAVLGIAQDRGLEKSFARNADIGTADFAVVGSADELEIQLKNFTRPCILKSTRMGYDGKGQVKITDGMSASQAWSEMGSNEGIIESFVDFTSEISVIVARRDDGVMEAYPPVQNIHKNHILSETHAPADIDQELADEAIRLAKSMTEEMKVVGLLAIELFVLASPNEKGQRVLLNEVAPRPHNSGHWTIDACACSQYEMLVRAVCGLPLGSGKPHHKAMMHNIVGDEEAKFEVWMADPKACLHLYGKKETREGRKMGHVTFLKEAL